MSIDLKIGSVYVLRGGHVLRYHGLYAGKGPLLSFRAPSVKVEEGSAIGASFDPKDVVRALTGQVGEDWLRVRREGLLSRGMDVEVKEIDAALCILSAEHWDRLAVEKDEQAASDTIGSAPVRQQARTYRAVAQALRLEAETGRAHCADHLKPLDDGHHTKR